jgi:hypothetical protein
VGTAAGLDIMAQRKILVDVTQRKSFAIFMTSFMEAENTNKF